MNFWHALMYNNMVLYRITTTAGPRRAKWLIKRNQIGSNYSILIWIKIAPNLKKIQGFRKKKTWTIRKNEQNWRKKITSLSWTWIRGTMVNNHVKQMLVRMLKRECLACISLIQRLMYKNIIKYRTATTTNNWKEDDW